MFVFSAVREQYRIAIEITSLWRPEKIYRAIIEITSFSLDQEKICRAIIEITSFSLDQEKIYRAIIENTSFSLDREKIIEL